MSVAYIGGYAWSVSEGDFQMFSSSVCRFTQVDGLVVSISQFASQQSNAISREFPHSVFVFCVMTADPHPCNVQKHRSRLAPTSALHLSLKS